jgi:hypothetical protein
MNASVRRCTEVEENNPPPLVHVLLLPALLLSLLPPLLAFVVLNDRGDVFWWRKPFPYFFATPLAPTGAPSRRLTSAARAPARPLAKDALFIQVPQIHHLAAMVS